MPDTFPALPTEADMRRLLPKFSAAWLAQAAASIGVLMFTSTTATAQVIVPGTGMRIEKVGDDFEDANWNYNHNQPKSSSENDEQQRMPGGFSTNGRWAEGILRGQPDLMRRVATPPGGVAGSEGSMLMVTRTTGVPGNFSGQNHQDDLIALVDQRIGGPISVARSPSVVVRVYLPPWDKWEQRSGNSFGFRAACKAYITKKEKSNSIFKGFASTSGRNVTKLDTYWPGMFIQFDRAAGADKQPQATLVVRAGPSGNDFWGPKITEPGWWTLGMSFSPDGQVHYFAHAGVEDLTAADHIASQYPYGYKAEQFDCFFFDLVNGDNGNWSTPWIVDDAFVYVAR